MGYGGSLEIGHTDGRKTVRDKDGDATGLVRGRPTESRRVTLKELKDSIQKLESVPVRPATSGRCLNRLGARVLP